MHHFFETIHQKANFVDKVFTSVAQRYDIMNDAMSLGTHRLWKRIFVDMIPLIPQGQYLDISAGTGDISIALKKKLDKTNTLIEGLTVSDINSDILNIAKQRMNNLPDITFKIVDATNIDYQNQTFNVATCSFGVRNFFDTQKGLQEIFRIIKDDGYFCCMEFMKPVDGKTETLKSQPFSIAFNKIYNIYLDHIVPKIGKVVAKDEESYKYLAKSIQNFVTPKEMCEMLQNVGFRNVVYRPLLNDLIGIFICRR